MTILGVHHIQITVAKNEEAAARAFYVGVLGLPEVEKPAPLKERGGFWLQVGDQTVHVGLEDGVDRWQTKGHIAYQVQDLVTWRSVITAAGLTVLESVPIPGYERFEFRDPFGNRVEMIMEIINE